MADGVLHRSPKDAVAQQIAKNAGVKIICAVHLKKKTNIFID
jgi:hypothetical protein